MEIYKNIEKSNEKLTPQKAKNLLNKLKIEKNWQVPTSNFVSMSYSKLYNIMHFYTSTNSQP